MMFECSSKQTQSHVRQCLIYIATFDSGTRTPLDSKLSCIASSGENGVAASNVDPI